MSRVGYAFLRAELALSVPPPRRVAEIRPVNRVEEIAGVLAIPARVAPATRLPLDHILFALKHEGTHLAILMSALRHVSADAMQAAVAATPSGQYVRVAGFLWEIANGQTLPGINTPATTPVCAVFDPERYVTTATGKRDARWRVNFNGLGSPRYCATVERTAAIAAGIGSEVLRRARQYAEGLDDVLRDRALAWAYLHETEQSYAIEREVPSQDRAKTFVALLHQAHERRPLSEDYLVALQQATVTNPYLRASAFRTDQNHLAGELRGAAGVTYVPPPPLACAELMHELMAFANNAPGEVDPIVAASVASFGFVFLHPFGDGNGRLSRFLFHHALCRSGELADGLILPVSVAMKKHERDYLAALQSFSKPMRELWDVRWIDEGLYEFNYQGDPDFTAYRYWDATPCVEFGFAMAEQALELELRQEAEFLMRFDAIVRRVNAEYDVAQSDLTHLVKCILDQGGRLSANRRDRFRHRVPDATLDAIARIAGEVLADGLESVPDDLGTPAP